MGSFYTTVKLSSKGLKTCVLHVRNRLQLRQLETRGAKSVSDEHGVRVKGVL